MSAKSSLCRLLELAGVVSVVLITTGCCSGRFSIRRTCHCAHQQQASTVNPEAYAVEFPANPSEAPVVDYFADQKNSDTLLANSPPATPDSETASRQPIEARKNQSIAEIGDSADGEPAQPAELLAKPHEIEMADASPDTQDSVADAVQEPAETEDENLGDQLVSDERSYGSEQEGWQAPSRENANSFELPSPTNEPALVEQEPANPASIIGPINRTIVLRAKVVQPLVRPLPDDTRVVQGRKLNPAKPAGYSLDEQEKPSQISQSNEATASGAERNESTASSEAKPLIHQISTDRAQGLRVHPVVEPGQKILRAIPKASEINFQELPRDNQPIQLDQTASPGTTGASR